MHIMDDLLILVIRPFIGLLTITVAELDCPIPKCVYLICNGTRFTLALASKHFYCPVDKLYTSFTLAVSLVIP